MPISQCLNQPTEKPQSRLRKFIFKAPRKRLCILMCTSSFSLVTSLMSLVDQTIGPTRMKTGVPSRSRFTGHRRQVSLELPFSCRLLTNGTTVRRSGGISFSLQSVISGRTDSSHIKPCLSKAPVGYFSSSVQK